MNKIKEGLYKWKTKVWKFANKKIKKNKDGGELIEPESTRKEGRGNK